MWYHLGGIHSVEPWLISDARLTSKVAKSVVQVTCANKVEYSQRCDSNPCKNGQCLGGIDDFYCLCDVNWKGKICDEKSN